MDMLARLSALGAALMTWARQHRDAPLAEQEAAVLAAVRAALSTGLTASPITPPARCRRTATK